MFIDYRLFEIKIKKTYNKNNVLYLKCSLKLIPFNLKSFYPIFSDKSKIVFPYTELSDWDAEKIINIIDDKKIISEKADNNLRSYAVRDCYILKQGLFLF